MVVCVGIMYCCNKYMFVGDCINAFWESKTKKATSKITSIKKQVVDPKDNSYVITYESGDFALLYNVQQAFYKTIK